MDLENSLDIAVIGMACNFPGAKNLEKYWDILKNGVETIREISEDELINNGITREQFTQPDYVKAASILDDIDLFDAGFFGFSPNEVKCMDPQQRLFLECCWHAFENAGIDPIVYNGAIAVFSGAGMNSYISDVIIKNPDYLKTIDTFQLLIGNDKDFLTTQVSYRLNLKGPSVNVNTACSTSLVAIHLARQSLLLGECDMALAGGVSIFLPNRNGYVYIKDAIRSPDGHCRAFDDNAAGTIWGDGCGVVVLKRLIQALKDRDHIYAVIKGSAINNDGSLKAGFTAPSVNRQSAVIVEALAASDLSPDQISFIEAHGTGTSIGDPIEIAGLTQAFREGTDKKQYCPIGSVKTNFGHLNTAAGIAGFIKAVLSVYNKKLPPSLNYQKPNKKIDFQNSPFYVNTELFNLEKNNGFIYGGISSMGIGGTNAHVIIAECPPVEKKKKRQDMDKEYILLLSAHSDKVLENMINNLANFLENNTDLSLNDIAFTLQCGRHSFVKRIAVVCRSIKEAVSILRNKDSKYFIDDKSIINLEKTIMNREMIKSWMGGEQVNWMSLYQNEKSKRIPLPLYPFDRKRFWIDPIITEDTQENLHEKLDHYQKLDNIKDWFYMTSWKQAALLPVNNRNPEKYLVFNNHSMICRKIIERLKEHSGSVFLVSCGDEYKQQNNFSYTVCPEDSKDFAKMLNTLQNSGNLPDKILFFWTLGENINDQFEVDFDFLVSTQDKGFFSLLHFAKAINGVNINKAMELICFTDNIFEIIGDEELNLANSTIPGVCLVMQQELYKITSKVVDIELKRDTAIIKEELIDLLLTEIKSNDKEIVCAIRGTKRFVRRYDHFPISDIHPSNFEINKDDICLVYCGSEGIGYLVTQYIKEEKNARLLLLEEYGFPEKEDWESIVKEFGEDHPIGARIINILKFIESGAIYLGSITNYEDMCNNIKKAEMEFGKIKGIIHAPGASNAKRMKFIRDSSVMDWKENFLAVGYSILILDKFFNDVKFDFKIMLNSLGSILGGIGFVNVATIGNYIKSYNKIQKQMSKQPWSIQCWDSWTIEWDDIKATVAEKLFANVERSIITKVEGLKSFEYTYILRNFPEIIISATDLEKRYNRWIKMDSLKKTGKQLKYSRPDLDTEYKAPETDLEKKIEEIFSNLLGIEKIGINDDFFELGGNSLLAIQLVQKLTEKYNIQLEKQTIVQYATINILADYIIQNNLLVSS